MAELSLVRVIEGVLFAAREPVSIQALKKVFEEGPQNPSEGMLREALSRLAADIPRFRRFGKSAVCPAMNSVNVMFRDRYRFISS